MKHIAKKTLSLLLALCLLVPFATTALAAEEGVRETNFFRHDLYHTDQDFSELEYKHIEAEPILKEIENIRKLMDKAANAAEVERRFWEVDDQMLELTAMLSITTIRYYMDVYDEAVAGRLAADTQDQETLDAAIGMLTRDLLGSPCGDFLRKVLNEDQIKMYLEYGDADPNPKLAELKARDAELTSKAGTLLVKTYTVEVDGKEWDLNGVSEAENSGGLTKEDADAIRLSIYAAKNEELGSLYLEMLPVRNEIARAMGYDSYPEYAYKEDHFRDYTPDGASRLYADTKEYIAPLYEKVEALYNKYQDENWEFFNHDFVGDGDGLVNLVEPYMGRISSEVRESFAYMREHHLYDAQRSDTKFPNSFSVLIHAYGAPYYYQYPRDTMKDFSGVVHEFGHYNNSYYSGFDEDQHYIMMLNECADTTEVHSQGFELLFSRFYDEIFGEDAGLAEVYLHYGLLSAIIRGNLYDEFQQYAYATEDVTLEQLNRKFYELAREYGFSVTGEDGQAYSWVDVNHTFTFPCYYISYATSAAGAYAFWDAAQSDYFGAVDKYLQFVALGPETGFQASFKAVGMTNPLSEGYLKELSEMLYEKLGLSEENPFDDVDEDSPYYDAILWAVEKGITKGTSDTTFTPDDPCTQAQIVTFLWRAMGEPAPTSTEENPFPTIAEDSPYYQALLWAAEQGITEGAGEAGFDPGAPCTRAQSVSFQWRAAGQPEATASVSFDDVDAAGDYAAAVAWAVEKGITKGTGETTFSPDVTCTRAQIVTFLYRDLG